MQDKKTPNPLIMAMRMGDPGNANVRPALQKPRIIPLDASEVQPNAKPGDSFMACAYGRIKSVGKDGSLEGVIDYMEPMDDSEDESENEDQKAPIYVRTQESHTP